jgi:glutamyl-tRNA reductase
MCPFALMICLLGIFQLAFGLQATAATPRSQLGLSRHAMSAVARTSSLQCVATSPDLSQQQSAAAPAEAPADKKKKKRSGVHGKPMVIGLSHKTATVEVREKLSIQEAQWNQASASLCEFDSIQEAAVLSTCNRFEVYMVAEDHFEATRDAMTFLRQHSGLTDAELRPNLFVLQDEDATWHLLRVSAGLDSLVVGEGQILSQVKACYSHAISPPTEDEEGIVTEPAGSANKVLGRLLNSAVMAGKFVRSETEIAKGAVSISSAAVELAMLKSRVDLNKPLPQLNIAVIGAGKMSRLLLTHLASHGVTKVMLLNRSRPRAEELAAEYPDLDIEVKLMDEFWSTLETTDLAFTSTSATGCIVTKPELEEGVWGKGDDQQLMLIDISVPRNVEAQCNEVDGIFAYNVDDLKQVVAANQAKRRHKMLEAEVLLRVELAKFVQWQESLRYVPTIAKLQKRFEEVRMGELKKAQKKGLKGLDKKQQQAVDVATKGIINKLLHGPMMYLRSDDDGNKAEVQQIEELFMLLAKEE